MNLKKRLKQIANALDYSRRYGKTTVMANACKELNGIYLCNNRAEAQRVQRETGSYTESIEHNLEGINGPFFIDHHATAMLLHRAVNKIDFLEEMIDNLEKEKENLMSDLIAAQTGR